MRVGIIGLPGLAGVLERYGVASIGDPMEHLVSTTRIRQEIGSLDGVIVGTTQVQGLVTWIARRSDKGDRFVHLRMPGAEQLPCVNLEFPCALDRLLAEFDRSGSGVRVGAGVELVLVDGRVVERAAVPALAPAPAAPAPAPLPPPPPVAPPAPAAPAPAVQQPAPVQYAPGVVAQPAPVQVPAQYAPAPSPAYVPEARPARVVVESPITEPVPVVEPLGEFDWTANFEPTDPAPAPVRPADPGPSMYQPGPVHEAPQSPRAVAGDVDDWLDAAGGSRERRVDAMSSARAQRERLGEVIFVVARKGGVGKSTWTLGLAERAASRGVAAVAIDMNRGQADLATYVRARQPRRITNALMVEPFDLSNAVVTPEMLSRYGGRGDEVHTDIVFGPDSSESHPLAVSSQVYRTLIEQARRRYGLVVVDTQTMEAADTSLLIDDVVKPMVGAGEAWALGLVGGSNPSVVNLVRTLRDWQRHGFPAERCLVMFNQQGGSDAEFDTEQAATLFSGIATVAGSAMYDISVVNAFNAGLIPSDLPVLAAQFDSVLWRVTGSSVFERSDEEPRKRRFWRR